MICCLAEFHQDIYLPYQFRHPVMDAFHVSFCRLGDHLDLDVLFSHAVIGDPCDGADLLPFFHIECFEFLGSADGVPLLEACAVNDFDGLPSFGEPCFIEGLDAGEPVPDTDKAGPSWCDGRHNAAWAGLDFFSRRLEQALLTFCKLVWHGEFESGAHVRLLLFQKLPGFFRAKNRFFKMLFFGQAILLLASFLPSLVA